MNEPTGTPTGTRATRSADGLEFASPDGRVWERDVDHQAGPRAPMMRTLFDDAFEAGTNRAFERLGAPLSHGEGRHINGWSYLRLVPAGAPDKPGAGGPPPPFVLKVLTRVVPELRRRNRIARDVVDNERWMEDVRAWWEERPRWESAFRARQAIDLDRLDDTALAGEVSNSVDEGLRMLVCHFELIPPGAGVGMAAVKAVQLGLEPIVVPDALQGTSTSTAGPRALVARIAAALDAVGAGPISTLAEACAASAEAASLIDEHLGTYGWRLLGDDLDAPTLAESPDVLARAITAARGSGGATPAGNTNDTGDRIAALVARVPAAERDEFERLLRNAGDCYEMLDDNSSLTCWGLGVARRTLLEAGRRLVERGVLASAEELGLLDTAEVAAALRGDSTVTRDELDRRAADFEVAKAADPPSVVGGEPAPPPDPSVFPSGLRAIAEAVGLYLSLRFPPEDERADTGRVEIDGRVVANGHGIGDSVATGRAVVATTADKALDRLQPGDVLVCPVTNPAYNVVFPIAAAVVTAAGGPFGHTAVTAREVGIPAVVGIGDLSVIPDGAQISVVSR